jgi:exonuclease SbcC
VEVERAEAWAAAAEQWEQAVVLARELGAQEEQARAEFTVAEKEHEESANAWARWRAQEADVRERAARAAAQLEAARGYARAREEREVAQARLARCLTDAAAAQQHEAALRAARIQGIASELALDLEPGAPCPVCGSTKHPAPAQMGPEHVDKEAVAAAQQVCEEHERQLEQARASHAEISARAAELKGASGSLGVEEAQLQLADVDKALAEGQALEPKALAAQEQLRVRQEALNQAAELARKAERAAADAQAAASSLSTQDAGQALARAQEQAARVAALAAATGAAHQAHETYRELAAGRDAALRDQGFDTPAAVNAARMDAAAADALERELAAQDAREAECRARIAALTAQARASDAATGGSPTTEGLAAGGPTAESPTGGSPTTEGLAAEGPPTNAPAADAPTPEVLAGDREAYVEVVAARQAAESVLVQEVSQATQKLALAQERARGVAAAQAGVTQAANKLGGLIAESAALLRIAGLANGEEENIKGVTLPSYVLMRRFEEVVDAANERLGPMSSGRFRLERTDEREATRARRTGLAVRVMDSLTDQARDPRTLSGGETFYVSLALALGLADVVTAEAGGLDLGTLFIDEGFGSLDPEVLDAVLVELGRLRAAGRTVGVVSHVSALKQTIAERVEVRRKPNGVSTLTVRA